jgi:catechol-2,3-dioxygenase
MQLKNMKKLIAVLLTTAGLTASTSLFAIANQNQPKTNLQADMGLETLQIYNVAISVPDIDESVRWYSDKLGFKLQSRK